MKIYRSMKQIKLIIFLPSIKAKEAEKKFIYLKNEKN